MRGHEFARRVELYSPESEVELLLLQSVLDAAGIDYFVKNTSDEPPPRRTPDERSPVPRRGPPRLKLVHPRRRERREPRDPEPHDPDRSGPATPSGARDRTPER